MFRFMVHDATRALTVRMYGTQAGDWQTVASWWDRSDGELYETLLPPLGVIVECGGEPLAALWCYESFGIGVAFIDFPCTAPGLPPRVAHNALVFAEHAIVTVLRSNGQHKLIRGFCQPRHAATIKRMGYKVDVPHLTSVMKRID